MISAQEKIVAPEPPRVAAAEMELATAILRKDRKATAEFVERYADPIHGYLRHRLLPRTDLADDLLQEVFLAAWRSLKDFRGRSSLKIWLLGIARHKVEDHYRKRLREPEQLAAGEDVEPNLVEAPGIDEDLDRETRGRKMQQVLHSLPETYSTALLWRYWEHRSAAEMAERTGKTVKAIERLLARARSEFKRRWLDE